MAERIRRTRGPSRAVRAARHAHAHHVTLAAAARAYGLSTGAVIAAYDRLGLPRRVRT